MKEKQYLGDGAFAEFDGYSVMLTTRDGIRNTNTICMEPEVVKAFLRYFAAIDPNALRMMRDVVSESATIEDVSR